MKFAGVELLVFITLQCSFCFPSVSLPSYIFSSSSLLSMSSLFNTLKRKKIASERITGKLLRSKTLRFGTILFVVLWFACEPGCTVPCTTQVWQNCSRSDLCPWQLHLYSLKLYLTVHISIPCTSVKYRACHKHKPMFGYATLDMRWCLKQWALHWVDVALQLQGGETCPTWSVKNKEVSPTPCTEMYCKN
jgi:hypothetical protein